MKRARIELLLRELPIASLLYLATGPRGQSNLTTQEIFEERLAQACQDPKFAWKYVSEFLRLKLPLPVLVNEKYMEWVYQHKMGHMYHADVVTALMFNKHGWENARGCLNASLCDRNIPLSRLARLFDCTVQAITIYERLFFPIRDRWDDTLFFATLCHPYTRLVEQNPDYIKHADASTIMMIQSVSQGKGADGAMRVLGAPKLAQASEEMLITSLRKDIFSTANEAVQMGGLMLNNNPAIRNVRPLLVAREMNPNAQRESTDSEAGLGALELGPGDALMITMNGLTKGSEPDRGQKFETVSLMNLKSANPTPK